MIKKVLATLFLFALTCVGCNLKETVARPHANVEEPNKDVTQQTATGFYQPSITVDNETVPEIARSLLRKYLEHYASNEVSESERLRDFKMNEITIKERTDNGLFFSARFSVQGFNDNTPWDAGNGVIKEHGWIEDKFVFINVIEKGNTYTMTGWGTSP